MTYVQTTHATDLALETAKPRIRRSVRQERLERLADLFERYDGEIQLLSRMEYMPSRQRRNLTQDYSPAWLAFQDQRFRDEGLASDRLSDIMRFFELSDHEAHELLCNCHYYGHVTASMVAERARELARKKTTGQVLRAFWQSLFGGATA